MINKPKIKTAVSHSPAIPATNKTNETKVTFDKSLKEYSSSKSKHTSGEKFPKSNTITSPGFAKEGKTTKSGLASLEQIPSRSRANAIPEDKKKKWVSGKKLPGSSQGF